MRTNRRCRLDRRGERRESDGEERREERRGEERDGEESEVMSVSMVNDTNNEY